MKKTRQKCMYQYRAWVGVDASNETSLFEYGWLYNPNAKPGVCNILHGVQFDDDTQEYTTFAYSSIDWDDIKTESWIEWDKVAETCGQPATFYAFFSIPALSDLVNYYGFENVFGTNYYEGFAINK